MKRISMELDLGLARKLSTLALLPANEIEITFQQLKEKYETADNSRLFSYFSYEWLGQVYHLKAFYSFSQVKNTLFSCFLR